MKNTIFKCFTWIIVANIVPTMSAQVSVNPRIVCQLPAQLGESSGLFVPTANQLWSHGDSGNPNELYLIDSLGKLKRTVVVRNATNVDWEDVSADSLGNLYVGDFGNNANARRDLTIYKIPNFTTLQRDTADAGLIKFSYPDQTAFPPVLSAYLFDCEAMLVFSDSIFLIAKDYHAVPYTGVARIYRIPNAIGTHVATFVAQVATDNTDKHLGAITGMCISLDRKTVVLTAHRRLYIAQGFQGRAFWSVNWQKAYINSAGNKEAVAFRDACTLYLTDDNGGVPAGNLYTIDLCQLKTQLTPTAEITPIEGPLSINAFPNPSTGFETINLSLSKTLAAATLDVFDLTGRLIFSQKINNADAFTLDDAVFKGQKGLFLLRLHAVRTNELVYKTIVKL